MTDNTGKPTATVHAAAVLVGLRAVLIRGPAGAGKSRLALGLIQAAQCGLLPFARLVGDDRIELTAVHGRLLARPAPALAGLIEVRGLGIRRLEHESVAVVGLVVDLASTMAERLPGAVAQAIELSGVILPLLPIAPDSAPLPAVLAWLLTASAKI
jgi:serine kinase of HPr protein (carbohydrate metabolism regulator)